MVTMRGPFGFDWENEIESIKTGPKATIAIYDNENFVERSERVGPSVEMRNVVCLDLEELHMELHLAIGRLRQKRHLFQPFFAGAELEL
jgi:hypothetical protein